MANRACLMLRLEAGQRLVLVHLGRRAPTCVRNPRVTPSARNAAVSPCTARTLPHRERRIPLARREVAKGTRTVSGGAGLWRNGLRNSIWSPELAGEQRLGVLVGVGSERSKG